MKLHNGLSPNGLRVTVFLAEKGLEIPVVPVDILGGEPRREPFLSLNPLGEVPVLELDDGSVLTESVAICRYIEGLFPDPPLFGMGAKGQAVVEMWNRRLEQRVHGPLSDVARHEFAFFKERGPQFADFARARRSDYRAALGWLDREMSDGRSFVAGDAFSVADITGMAMLLLAHFVPVVLPEELKAVKRWESAMKARPSWPKLPQ